MTFHNSYTIQRRMDGWQTNLEGFRRKRRLSVWDSIPLLPEGTERNHTPSQDSRCSGRVPNQISPEFEGRVLSLLQPIRMAVSPHDYLELAGFLFIFPAVLERMRSCFIIFRVFFPFFFPFLLEFRCVFLWNHSYSLPNAVVIQVQSNVGSSSQIFMISFWRLDH